MELHIVLEGRKNLTGQLYQQLRNAIQSGSLGAGQQLPPSRLLSEQLGVSRKTVAEAYAKLTVDNFLITQVGIGTFVTSRAKSVVADTTDTVLAASALVGRWRSIETPLRHPAPDGTSRYEFIGGYASKVPFPMDAWRRSVLAGLRLETATRGRYAEAEGVRALRGAIARHVGFTRGVRCTDHNVIITNGAQQALDLIARVLIEPDATVVVEEPGYPPARLLFESQGANVIGARVDAEGIVVDDIPVGTRLIYVTPSHQFPLGMAMSNQRRLELLACARRLGAVIIEDDYDSAFRYEGSSLDSLQSMDRDGLVAYVGTLSKVLLPEVRIGYLIAPPALLDAATTAKHLTDWHTATLLQHAVTNFIDGGELAKHIRRCHATFTSRREKILHRLGTDLSDWLEAIPAIAGFHLSARFRRPVDLELLCRMARRVEVGLYTTEPFYQQQNPHAELFLGFGAIDTIDIDTALDRVHQILCEISR